jgi:hypothetical protein
MDWTVAGKALALQIALVFATALILALALPHSFFEDWGWLSGPVAWLACAAIIARILRLPITGALAGAILAGLPSLVAVLAGVHWLGAVIAAALFALWCGRLRVDPELEAELV